MFYEETGDRCVDCSSAIKRCSSCPDNSHCDICRDGYFPNNVYNRTSRAVAQECVFASCESGEGVNIDNTLCEVCTLENCKSCDYLGVCDSCIPKTVLGVDGVGAQTCTPVTEGSAIYSYYVEPTSSSDGNDLNTDTKFQPDVAGSISSPFAFLLQAINLATERAITYVDG